MHLSSKSSLFLSVLLLTTCGGTSPVGEADLDSRTRMEAQLQEAIEVWASSAGHRGVSAAVVFDDGSEWVSTAGVNFESSPLRPDHLISVASITKSMTGAVILQLVEEGALALDDPISRWLDPMENVPGAITVRQLLNHTSGIANYTGSAALGAALSAEPAHTFTRDEILGFLDPPVFSPGERTQYTNTSFLLLGMIAERAAGDDINALYQDRLFGPLGLTEIFMGGMQDPPGPVATGWAGPQADQATNPMESQGLLSLGQSAFGMFSNARTIARWGAGLFNGDILSSQMRSQMIDLVPAAGNIPGESGAGLGIRGYGYLGRTQYGHSGGYTVGSSLMFFDPLTEATVVVVMNQGRGADHFALAPELLGIVAAGGR